MPDHGDGCRKAAAKIVSKSRPDGNAVAEVVEAVAHDDRPRNCFDRTEVVRVTMMHSCVMHQAVRFVRYHVAITISEAGITVAMTVAVPVIATVRHHRH